MTDKLVAMIGEKYPLTTIDTEDMSHLKANGMKFTVRAFKAEGLGHVSVMKATGFFGLMRMDTLMITPTQKDLPLYSYDRIYAMGNDTLIVELYNTLCGEYSDEALNAIKTNYLSLSERDPGEHWYDSIKLSSSISKKVTKKDTALLDEMTEKHFEAYLKSAPEKECDESLKKEKSASYVNGLLRNGGPSTDVFKKSLGEEKTEKLFKKILFGIE